MTQNDSSSISKEVFVLEMKNKAQDPRCGHLPSPAPLANAYVPFQPEGPQRYEARKGFIRGTLFTGLDLPFMGMVNQKEKAVTPLSELQVLGFAIQELALYLDTHRDDAEALELYRNYQQMYDHCRAEYLKNRGPMNHTQMSDDKQYTWLNDPWPWEYCKNKEV